MLWYHDVDPLDLPFSTCLYVAILLAESKLKIRHSLERNCPSSLPGLSRRSFLIGTGVPQLIVTTGQDSPQFFTFLIFAMYLPQDPEKVSLFFVDFDIDL